MAAALRSPTELAFASQSVHPQQRKKQHIMETSATDSTAVTTPQSAASTRSGTSRRTSSGHRLAAAPSCSGRDHCHCHQSWTRRCAGGEGNNAARLGRPRSGGHRSMETRLPPMGPPRPRPAPRGGELPAPASSPSLSISVPARCVGVGRWSGAGVRVARCVLGWFDSLFGLEGAM